MLMQGIKFLYVAAIIVTFGLYRENHQSVVYQTQGEKKKKKHLSITVQLLILHKHALW